MTARMHTARPAAALRLALLALCAGCAAAAATVPRAHAASRIVDARRPAMRQSSAAALASVRGGASSHAKPQPFESHLRVDQIPDSLVRQVGGNYNMRQKFEQLCRNAQASICRQLEELDGGATFRTDSWVRPDGGGGVSRVLAKGRVFEKAGVNLSVVYGNMPKVSAWDWEASVARCGMLTRAVMLSAGSTEGSERPRLQPRRQPA